MPLPWAVPLLLALVTLAPAPAAAQEILHPDRIAPLLARERLSRDATRDAELAREIRSARTAPARRVELARERAEQETRLQSDLRLGREARLTVEPEAARDWRRLTGRDLRTVDAAARLAECVELARTGHVMSDAARDCRRRGGGTPLPEPLYVAGYRAAFAEDRRGDRSAVLYLSVERELRSRPADRELRLALAAMQVLTSDHRAALETLGALRSDDYEVRLDAALAQAGLGRREAALSLLVEAIRAGPRRAEAPFDLAQLLLGRDTSGRFARDVALRALAAYRLHLCHAAGAMPGPPDAVEVAAERAHALQVVFESPPNSWGGWTVRPLLPRPLLPASMRARWAPELPPSMTCDAARARASEVLLGAARGALPAAPPAAPAPPRARPCWPPVTAIVGPRPLFRWAGATDAELVVCADSRCVTPRVRVRGRGGAHTLADPLPPGRWFWRVADGPIRVLWVAPHARSAQRVADVDGDGWPDVPLGRSGWLARFTGDAVPALIPLPGEETATASAAFAGDLDGDGYGDLVQASAYGLLVLYGSAGGPESPQTLATEHPVSWAMAAGDVDGDGFDDLLVDLMQRPDLLLGGPRGVRPRVTGVVEPLAWRHVPVGDLDGDGRQDAALFVNDYQARTGRWSFHLGTRGGVAEAASATLGSGYEPWALEPLGDLTGDGRADVALWSPDRDERDPPGRFRIYAGSARGITTRPLAEVPTSGPYVFVEPVGDVDGDGHDDLIWRDGERVSWRAGRARGLGPTVELGGWPARSGLCVARLPDAEPAVVWLLGTLSSRALRVERGHPEPITLALP